MNNKNFNSYCFVFLLINKLLMKKTLILFFSLLLLCFNIKAQYFSSIGTETNTNVNTDSKTNLFAEIAMLEVEWRNDNQEIIEENISSYILGLSYNLRLNKRFDLISSLGFSEGFNYSFVNSNLGLKLSNNFHLFYGVGVNYINDEKWNVLGINGNEPSRYDFGMNMGLQLYLTDYIGLIMKYNIIEEKEENVSSMSANGLSFGLILK